LLAADNRLEGLGNRVGFGANPEGLPSAVEQLLVEAEGLLSAATLTGLSSTLPGGWLPSRHGTVRGCMICTK
jgi:hypothetical protein